MAVELPYRENDALVMHSLAWWATLFTVSIAAVADLRSRRIPNWLVGSSLLAALVTAVVTHGLGGLGRSVAGAALGGAILGVLYLMGGMGMGDVKLCAAVGAWIGITQLMIALVVTGVTGGVIAVAYAARGGFLKQTLDGAGAVMARGFGRRPRRDAALTLNAPGARSIPYAPAIAVGTIFSFLAR